MHEGRGDHATASSSAGPPPAWTIATRFTLDGMRCPLSCHFSCTFVANGTDLDTSRQCWVAMSPRCRSSEMYYVVLQSSCCMCSSLAITLPLSTNQHIRHNSSKSVCHAPPRSPPRRSHSAPHKTPCPQEAGHERAPPAPARTCVRM